VILKLHQQVSIIILRIRLQISKTTIAKRELIYTCHKATKPTRTPPSKGLWKLLSRFGLIYVFSAIQTNRVHWPMYRHSRIVSTRGQFTETRCSDEGTNEAVWEERTLTPAGVELLRLLLGLVPVGRRLPGSTLRGGGGHLEHLLLR
jgi:hypothetical protein